MTIEKHEWFDEDVQKCLAKPSYIDVSFHCRIDQMMVNKQDAQAIAKHFGLIGGSNKPESAIDLRKEMNAKIKAIKEEYRMLIKAAQDKCDHQFGIDFIINTFKGGPRLNAIQCAKCGKRTTKGL